MSTSKKVLMILALVVFTGGIYVIGKAVFPMVREKMAHPVNRVLYGENKNHKARIPN